jgi:glycosyltransferase involved in cell wall biosynthesis
VGDVTTQRAARRVLFLAYYFPPLGGGGVQRSLAFTRYLPEHGYEPLVVTGPAAGEVEWGPGDTTLLGRLNGELEIARVAGPERSRSRGWRHRGERIFRLEDEFGRWWVNGAVAAADDALATTDVIYASMSPFETGRAAAQLAAASGKPWVADLRDPWALDDWLAYPSRLHRRLELRTMRQTLATAAAIVMNTPDARRELLRRAPELGDRPVLTIPNGFDPSDFDGPAPEPDPAVFRIVHAGHVFTKPESGATRLVRRTLGGTERGLETSTRSHVYLVRAIDRLLDRRPDLRGAVRLELVGPMSEADRASLPEYGVSHGYLAHQSTIELLRAAGLLFLPMHDLAEGLRARIIPGKTYEYLAAMTPVLGAVPDGDARELLEAAGNADVCRPADVDGMSAAIERRADDWLAGLDPPAPDPDLLRRFDRRRLTAELAGVFDLLLGPAAVPVHHSTPEVPA